MAKIFVLNGDKITSLETFYDEIGSSMALGESWGRNLDALDDILGGGDWGIPEGSFTLKWINSDHSRANLGYPETILQLEKRLLLCSPASRESVRAELHNAQQCKGYTVFDWLIDLIRRNEGRIRLLLA